MDVQQQVSQKSPIVSDRAGRDLRDHPEITAEVEQLLTRRTRDIRLEGELNQLYRARIWSQTAKIIRAWMIWVAVLHVTTIASSILLLPGEIAASMLLPGGLIAPVAIAVAFVWKRPHGTWLQGFSLMAGMFLILLSIALIGVSAGGEFYERNLHIMLFVAITAIIIFGVPLAWTVANAAFALGLYLAFQLANPALELGSVVSSTLFFTTGVLATVAARRNMTILAQKTFLFELRDRRRVAELAEINQRLEHLARTDPLTGIANRRRMTEMLDQHWDDDGHCPDRVAVLMCDIDEFKKLNDRLGHLEGDRCLVEVAGIIQRNVRHDIDHVARYGGEEFLVLLPGVNEQEAVDVAERIRQSVESAAFLNPASRVSRYVTLSIGVAVRGPTDPAVSSDELQRNADAALYHAKQAGRNRVQVYRPHASGPRNDGRNDDRPPLRKVV